MLTAAQMLCAPVFSPAWAGEAETGCFGFGVEIAELVGGAEELVAANADCR